MCVGLRISASLVRDLLGYIRNLMVHRFVRGWIVHWLHVIGCVSFLQQNLIIYPLQFLITACWLCILLKDKRNGDIINHLNLSQCG